MKRMSAPLRVLKETVVLARPQRDPVLSILRTNQAHTHPQTCVYVHTHRAVCFHVHTQRPTDGTRYNTREIQIMGSTLGGVPRCLIKG